MINREELIAHCEKVYATRDTHLVMGVEEIEAYEQIALFIKQLKKGFSYRFADSKYFSNNETIMWFDVDFIDTQNHHASIYVPTQKTLELANGGNWYELLRV